MPALGTSTPIFRTFGVGKSEAPPNPVDYDILFAQPNFIPRLAASRAIRPFPAILFTGFHPDCTYLHANKKLILSPVGEYHSALIAACFVKGLPIERVAGWFTADSFGQLGYFAEFQRAKTFMFGQAAKVDFDLVPMFERWMGRRVSFMRTINHPATYVIEDICSAALAKEGIEGIPDGNINTIIAGAWWPVHPFLARRLGVAEQPTFRSNLAKDDLTLGEFITASYRAYECVSHDAITAAPSVARILPRLG